MFLNKKMFFHFTTFSFEIIEHAPKLILISLIPSYNLDEIEQVLLLKSRIIQKRHDFGVYTIRLVEPCISSLRI